LAILTPLSVFVYSRATNQPHAPELTVQIMIDLAQPNDPSNLRRMAALLLATADGIVPAGTVAAPAPAAAPIVAPSPPVEVMKANAGHASEQLDPAKVFGGATAPEVPAVPLVPAAPSVGNAAAPPADQTKTEAVSTAVELDGAGFPWDDRIHSTPAARNANGLWRMRRNTAKNPVTPELIQDVENEMRAKGYGVKPTAPAPVQATVPLPPGPVVPDVPAPPVAGVVVPAAPVSLPGNAAPGLPTGAPGVAGVPTGADAFRMMMDRFSKEMGPNGKLNKAAVAPIFAQVGVSGWGGLHAKPEAIPAVVAECERLTAVSA
jgi:hypothetical protein